MIRLTRLDGSEIYVNPEMIELIEEVPETHITLANGNRYLVLEPARVIIDRVVSLRARILRKSASEERKKYLRRNRGELYRPFCRLDT